MKIKIFVFALLLVLAIFPSSSNSISNASSIPCYHDPQQLQQPSHLPSSCYPSPMDTSRADCSTTTLKFPDQPAGSQKLEESCNGKSKDQTRDQDPGFTFSLFGLYESIVNQAKRNLQNDFIGGSLILTISGFFAAILFKLGNDIYQFFFNLIYLTVEINRGTDPYYWMTNYIVKNRIVQRSSRFMLALDSSFVNRSGMNPQAFPHPRNRSVERRTLQMPKLSLLPVGTKTTYKYLFQNNILWIAVEGDGHLNINKGMFLHGRNESPSNEKGYSLQIFNLNGLGQQVIMNLLKQAHEEYVKSNNDTVEMYVARHGNWERIGAKSKRSIDSVILDPNQASRILKDTTDFLTDQEWYTSRGIPYRRGYLLSGPPGVGKTSLIFALAGELNLCVCIIPLNSPDMDGYTLSRLLNTSPENGIVVLEDIDAAFTSREEFNEASGEGEKIEKNPGPLKNMKPEARPRGRQPNWNAGAGGMMMGDPFFPNSNRMRNGLSFSDLLNGIDGITGQEGRLLFMTTNHPEHLDPALVRPGRVDVHEKFHLATKEQIERLFARFFYHENDVEEMAKKFASVVPSEKHSMAKIQGFLMNYRHAPGQALENLHLLNESS